MLNMTRDVRESIILFERFIAQNYRRRKFAKVVGQKNGIRFCIFWREKNRIARLFLFRGMAITVTYSALCRPGEAKKASWPISAVQTQF